MPLLPPTNDPIILALAERLEAGERWVTGRELRAALEGTTTERNAHLGRLLDHGLIVAMGDAFMLTLRGALSCQRYGHVYENYLTRVLKALKAHEATEPGFTAVTFEQLASHDDYLANTLKNEPKWLLDLLVIAGVVHENTTKVDDPWPLKNPPLEQLLHDANSLQELVRLLAPSPKQALEPQVLAKQPEGQYLERKSLWEGPPSAKRPRERRTVRDEIAQYVAAFANADGGHLVLGIEDDGTVTGHGYPASAVDEFLQAPVTRLKPPHEAGERLHQDNKELLLFRVSPAAEAVMVVGDGFPRRVDDTVVQEEQVKINAWKKQGLVESWEARPSALQFADLDQALLQRASEAAGYGKDLEAFLLNFRLADSSVGHLKLRMAAALLFAREPHFIDHANVGVRVFRVVGKQRTFGAQANVEERERIDGNIVQVIERTKQLLDSLLRKPARLVGLRFQTTSEIPTLAWQEATVNAVGHRDYADQGRGVEIWLYDDRMEITSPGALVEGVSLEALRVRKPVHVSRNPRITRVLATLGIMRQQGEGIPRMFDEMAGNYLPAPTLDVENHRFVVTLRNTPQLTQKDARWLEQQASYGRTIEEVRALALARANGTVDNQTLRDTTGLDTLGASRVLTHLRDLGHLKQVGAGTATHYELRDAFPPVAVELESTPVSVGSSGPSVGSSAPSSAPNDTSSAPNDTSSAPSSAPNDTSSAPNDTSSAPSSAPNDTRLLPPDLQRRVESLGERAKPREIQALILALCAALPRTLDEIARILGRDERTLLRHHVKPLLAEGKLLRTHPDSPTHPNQAYRAPAPKNG